MMLGTRHAELLVTDYEDESTESKYSVWYKRPAQQFSAIAEEIIICGIIPRRDKWNGNAGLVNSIVRNYCLNKNTDFIDHDNINTWGFTSYSGGFRSIFFKFIRNRYLLKCGSLQGQFTY